MFEIHCFGHHGPDRLNGNSRRKVMVEQTCERCMHSFVASDEFIRVSETGHQVARPEPKDGSE